MSWHPRLIPVLLLVVQAVLHANATVAGGRTDARQGVGGEAASTTVDRRPRQPVLADGAIGVAYLPAVTTPGHCPWKGDVTGGCNHGPDPAPPGYDVSRRVAPVAPALLERRRQEVGLTPALSLCDGDGVSGPRVQVVYARLSNAPDRYVDYVDSIRYWVAEMDMIVRNSAAKTGGKRRVRFVHDGDCNLVIPQVVLSPAVINKFSVMVAEMLAQGYNRDDRKYLVFVDLVDDICGVAELYGDDRPGAENVSNSGPHFARVDAGCWGGHTAAHELMHNLGGVQRSAPHTSRGGHCVDEHDLMCYSDEPYYPPMQQVCTPADPHESLFDCSDDDYFHTNPPPGHYLDTHWNTARSVYLITDTDPPPPPDCPRVISDVNDWRRVVVACDGRIWQPEIIPGEPCSEFEVTFIAPDDGGYVFNGSSTELWIDDDGNGIPDRLVTAREVGKVIHLSRGAVYTARSFQPTPGFDLVPLRATSTSGGAPDFD